MEYDIVNSCVKRGFVKTGLEQVYVEAALYAVDGLVCMTLTINLT